jgi:hypothetical protein
MSNGLSAWFRAIAVAAVLCLVAYTGSVAAAVQTIDVQVSSSSDDAEEDGAGNVDLKSSDLEMVYDKGDQIIGIRFNNVTVPPGATVIDAWIQFTVDEDKATPTSLSIAGQLSNNAAEFTTSRYNISSRPLTSARVSWTPGLWNVVGAAGDAQRTPNLAPIIAETISQDGWSSGNSLAIIVSGTGERVAEAYNGDSPKAAKLHISYDTGGGTANTAPTVAISAPGDGTTITAGDPLSFTASATDNEQGNLTAALAWTSSLDGDLLLSGGNPSLLLSEGTHTITASVTDNGNLTGSDSITVIVLPAGGGNTAPTVNISSPADGTVIAAGESLAFSAGANDAEDGDITAALAWTSSIDGLLAATGGSVSLTLSQGTHVITAAVSDSGGLPATDAITVTVTPPGGVPEVLDLQISAGADDAEERATGRVSLTSSDLEMTFDKDIQTVGLRFPNVTIDPGAIITSAFVQFTADERNSEATSVVVSGEAKGNAAQFQSSNDNLSSRTRTSAKVGWNPPAWNNIGAAGAAERTPDLSSIINEIVNGNGWSRGNALALLIDGTGKRVAESANGKAGAAPILHIEYIYGGNRPPVVEAGADISLLLPANTVTLNGSVGDDGEPASGTLTSQWSHVGGTGAGQVVFANSGSADTTATINGSSAVGTYVLRLTGDDGELSSYDELIVSVSTGGTILSITQINYFDTGFANLSSPLAVPATDPAGVVYHPPSNRLIIADSEINEIDSAFSIVQANLFATPLTGGTVYDQWDTTLQTGNEPSRNREPTGIAYCANDNHFYVSNDDSRYIYRYAFDGTNFIAVDAFDSQGYSNDPEGITCDPTSGRLYVIGGAEVSIMVLSYDGGFVLEDILSLPSTAGNSSGVPTDPEGIAYDPGSGHLYILSSRDEEIFEYTLNGSFVNSFSIQNFSPKSQNAQGLSVGPSSDDPQKTSFYISDGMVDNDSNANERDGRIYEARINRTQ